jgi:hypothetical protein
MSRQAVRTTPLVPIPRAELEAQVGNIIHIAGLNAGCCWRLIRVEGDEMLCRTPVTQREQRFPAYRAQYSRRHEPEVREAEGE